MKQKVIEGLKKKILLVYEQEDSGFIESIKKDLSLTYIGKLTDIKEEKFGEFVDHPNSLTYHTAKESFFSSLESHGVYFKNKLGDRPEPCYDVIWDEEGDKALEKWQEAQSKVWNPGKTYLFIVSDINEVIIMEDKERAREVAIDFAWWLMNNPKDFQPSTPDGNYIGIDLENKSSNDLFELYLKSKNK